MKYVIPSPRTFNTSKAYSCKSSLLTVGNGDRGRGGGTYANTKLVKL